ncbi:DegV family protein [Nocardioides panacisoli]|uniref:DegV family protein n=1 Tax=Nocardioides panacisoli TaxID=627624 RepID=UPI001C63B65F|nr:DegV family protein [Nocardioides panacisoli]QYJ04638.1 DegV family protein [Nocardioides panacisoli]
MSVVVVTDSTASLDPEVAARRGVTVVPLQVIVDDDALVEGEPGATPGAVAQALRDKRSVSTSRPTPETFAATYARLAEEGATAVLSIHLSSDVSGTFESAQVAARRTDIPVTCVDTRQVGVATGYAALSAQDVIDGGGSVEEATAAAHRRAAEAVTYLYVDTLEYLRRGGRIGSAAALLGGALAVKPLLGIEEGVVATLEKVRTSARAIARLEALAAEAAGERAVEVTIAHLDSPDRAAEMADRVREELAEQLADREVRFTELGAVLGAHVGPGMLAICVAPLLTD